jgi:hypothetical protein
MWNGKIFKFLTALVLGFLTFAGEENPIYTPKVFFDTTQPVESLKKYDKNTAGFLKVIATTLNEELLQYLNRKGVIVYIKQGIGSDYTIFYTFPQAYIHKLSQLKEINQNKYYSYGYRVDINLALYVFKTSTNPQLVFYRTYHFLRYYPPKGQYLPLVQSLAEPIAESFYINLVKDLNPLIEKWKKGFKYYKHLGE